ncbi:hypothetical protein K435DRAFT_972766 [Dendrothele bispora CBS 962.96]|uniref:Uncharacterized protein n=1 Tax=Dendrothele bispora (strain CBS 962.96) TaxID=1314807 RepID=A0A4S8KWW8_DENBC|nr:hypothetical protein K435DRAFT_972766 [Dendrothele bispora CBS 962.96]
MALNALGAYFIAHLVQHAFFAFTVTTTTTLTATRTRREHFPSEENLEDQDEILSLPSRIDSSRSPSPTQSNQPENLPASPLLSFSPCSTSNSDKLSPSANLETEHPDSPLFPFPQPDTSPSSPTGESAIEDATLKDMSLSSLDSPQTLDTIPGALVHVLDWHTDTILDTVRLFCEDDLPPQFTSTSPSSTPSPQPSLSKSFLESTRLESPSNQSGGSQNNCSGHALIGTSNIVTHSASKVNQRESQGSSMALRSSSKRNQLPQEDSSSSKKLRYSSRIGAIEDPHQS